MSFFVSNIEQIEAIFGMVALIVCTAAVFIKRTWPNAELRLFARGFFGTSLLGELYWTIYTLVFGFTPVYFYVSELAWFAGDLFLLLFVIELYCREGKLPIHPAAWIGPAAVVALTAWFIAATGDPLSNIATGFVMAGVSLFSLSALFRSRRDRADGIVRYSALYAATTAFVALEYLIWSCSVLDSSVGISNPYYWFGPVMYLSIIAIAAAVMRMGVNRGEKGA